jgi:hypothetical protein
LPPVATTGLHKAPSAAALRLNDSAFDDLNS